MNCKNNRVFFPHLPLYPSFIGNKIKKKYDSPICRKIQKKYLIVGHTCEFGNEYHLVINPETM